MSVQRWDIERRDYDDYDLVYSPTGDWVKTGDVLLLSKALADMIDMYESKKRDHKVLSRARVALTNHGIWPERPSQQHNEQAK